MPARTKRQAHTAEMAYAVKTGRASMADMPPGAHDAIQSMMSMSEQDLKDMMTTAKKREARGMVGGTKRGR